MAEKNNIWRDKRELPARVGKCKAGSIGHVLYIDFEGIRLGGAMLGLGLFHITFSGETKCWVEDDVNVCDTERIGELRPGCG